MTLYSTLKRQTTSTILMPHKVFHVVGKNVGWLVVCCKVGGRLVAGVARMANIV